MAQPLFRQYCWRSKRPGFAPAQSASRAPPSTTSISAIPAAPCKKQNARAAPNDTPAPILVFDAEPVENSPAPAVVCRPDAHPANHLASPLRPALPPRRLASRLPLVLLYRFPDSRRGHHVRPLFLRLDRYGRD